jgi:hypothetical protein
MAQRGAPLWEITRFLGHSGTRIVETHDAHHRPDYRHRAAGDVGVAPQLRAGIHIRRATRRRGPGWRPG